MPKRHDDTEEKLSIVGAYAVGGPGLAGAFALGGYLSDHRSSLDDLGPAPIGSDPWLRTEVARALASEPGLDRSDLRVEALEAVVTLRGTVASSREVELAERAARTVKGIRRLEVELAIR